MSFKTPTAEYDDSGLKEALKEYCNWRKNIDPDKELKKRAIAIGYKLVKIYVTSGAQKEQIITQLKSLGYRVRIRQRFLQRGKAARLSRKKLIAMEVKARTNAVSFTASGWFAAIQRLGGNPSRGLKRKLPGVVRGDLKEKLGGVNPFIELINLQPAAALVADRDGGAIQTALDLEVADIMVYVLRKQSEVAKRNGL